MNKYIKVSSKDIYIPQKLLDHIIKESDVMPITIEEEQSEIFFGSSSGLGKVVFKNNLVFEGNVKYGILDSGDDKRSCAITFPNQTRYDGQIRNNSITGYGTYKFNSVKNGLRNGKGIFTTLDGLRYDGEWLNGLKDGYGTLTIQDDITYEGDWVEGIKQGSGRVKWVSGNLFDGEFKNNKINGNGFMIWYDTNEKYTGQWIDNLQNGLGIQIWFENKGEQKYLRNRYVGEWKNGFRHGYGIFFYSNGSKYEGMWDQNYKHGFGVFSFQDGEQYIGRFHNDKMIDYNSYGFSIPNMSMNKAQSDRLATDSSKQGGKNNTKTEQLHKTANETKQKENNENTKSHERSDSIDRTSKEDLSDTNSKPDIKSRRKSIRDININLNININNNKGNALEAISEQAELFNMSVLVPDNSKLKDANPAQNNNNKSSAAENQNLIKPTNRNSNLNINSKNVANFLKEKKEKEFNIFQTLIDINDLIDCDPDIEANLRDVENTLLRHLSEMKMWYKYYINKEYQKDDENKSRNESMIDDKVSVKERSTSRRGTVKPDIEKMNELKEKFPTSLADKYEGIYSNDLSFAMELKDLWKFLRESNVLCIDFSLAQFNRLFFKGNKNYIEMFMPSEDINITNSKPRFYENIYNMIKKAKNDFSIKFRERLFTTNITNNIFGQQVLTNNLNQNTSSSPENTYSSGRINNSHLDNNNNTEYNENISEITSNNEEENFLKTKNLREEINFNDSIHNKRQIILLRHFYEAILRSAYLRYSHLSISLHSKINNLIETCIKTNINFKKVSKKSQMHTESSINSSIIVDMKQKAFDSNFEFFSGNFENRLRFSFKKIFNKSNTHHRLDDMTVTYRFFYEKIIKKSEILLSNFDKIKFSELINIYHKDKLSYPEEQKKITREQFIYIENLLDIEFIFYEYCELIFFITRKLLTKNNLNETKENYSAQITDIEELVDKMDSISFNDKFYYEYPKLKHHVKFENMIATEKAREEEELKQKLEKKRVELERNLMEVEDTNILPEFMEDDDYDEDSSMYSNF